MCLKETNIGSSYRIEEIKVEAAVERRLRALGMTKETPLTIMNKKKNGCIIFKVRGTRLAVGRRIAEAIQVKDMEG